MSGRLVNYDFLKKLKFRIPLENNGARQNDTATGVSSFFLTRYKVCICIKFNWEIFTKNYNLGVNTSNNCTLVNSILVNPDPCNVYIFLSILVTGFRKFLNISRSLKSKFGNCLPPWENTITSLSSQSTDQL